MPVRKQARKRLRELEIGYPSPKGTYAERRSPNVETDATLANMSFARTMTAGEETAPPYGGSRKVKERAGKLEMPKQSTAAVRREAEQEHGVMRNPGRVDMPGYGGFRESLSKKKKKSR